MINSINDNPELFEELLFECNTELNNLLATLKQKYGVDYHQVCLMMLPSLIGSIKCGYGEEHLIELIGNSVEWVNQHDKHVNNHLAH